MAGELGGQQWGWERLPLAGRSPGSREFDLLCFRKTHLSRWVPVFMEGKSKMGESVACEREGRKEEMGVEKGWVTVAGMPLSTCWVPAPTLCSCTHQFIDSR